VIHGVYTAALGAAVLVAAPSALYRRVARGIPLRLAQRLGYLPPRDGRPCGWIHAVSVGESITAAPIIEGLRRLEPSLPLVMTTVTETGPGSWRSASRTPSITGSFPSISRVR
jgi:3-deoxy-D-manno-octulosonic-acid transferase